MISIQGLNIQQLLSNFIVIVDNGRYTITNLIFKEYCLYGLTELLEISVSCENCGSLGWDGSYGSLVYDGSYVSLVCDGSYGSLVCDGRYCQRLKAWGPLDC